MSGEPIKLTICIPKVDAAPITFAYDLARMTAWTTANRPDINLTLALIAPESLQEDTRDEMVETVMRDTKCTHILVIDPELRFPKDAIPKLLASGHLLALNQRRIITRT